MLTGQEGILPDLLLPAAAAAAAAAQGLPIRLPDVSAAQVLMPFPCSSLPLLVLVMLYHCSGLHISACKCCTRKVVTSYIGLVYIWDCLYSLVDA